MKDYSFPAIRFGQNNQLMFLALPRMSDLFDVCDIDRWDPKFREEDKDIREIERHQGYQRIPLESRLKKIASYAVSPSGIFPANILLSARREVEFSPERRGSNVGELQIKRSDKLYIIDGQHRFYGIKRAIEKLEVTTLLDLEVPVTIMSGLSKRQEIEQFILINKTQKRVPTNLGDRLLEYLNRMGVTYGSVPALEQKDWKSRAVRLAERLNSTPGNPWHGRIIRPNSEKTEIAVAGESEFTKSLRHLLLSVYGKLTPNDDRAFETIVDYWNALQSLMPKAFAEPANYVIQKTTGFHSWNFVLPIVIRECADKFGRDRSIKNLQAILKRIDADTLTAEWWESGNIDGASQYVGMGPILGLADQLKSQLEEGDEA